MYATREEARNRLVGTIVAYDGRPVKVIDVGGRDGGVLSLSVLVWPFDGREPALTLPINDALFGNFVTPRLGFANFFERGNAHAIWCHRTPARRMQQGLVNGNFVGTAIGIRQQRFNLEHIQSSDGFREMIAGEYPVFETAVDMLVPDSSIAVDRNFALMQSPEGYVTIYHRRDPLGLVMRGVIYLREDRQYARELLLESDRVPNDIQNL